MLDYYSSQIPDNYFCSKCRITGVKLWRYVGTRELYCCDCAAKKDNSILSTLQQNGQYYDSDFGWTDQFGGCVPAIPSQRGESYWQYTMVPQDAINWWQRLPNRK